MESVEFYVFLNLLVDNFSEKIVGRLVRRGYGVMKLANELSHGTEESLATIVAVRLTVHYDPKKDKKPTVSQTLDDVRDVMKRIDCHYYSLIVTEPAHCTWQLGNATHGEAQKVLAYNNRKVN